MKKFAFILSIGLFGLVACQNSKAEEDEEARAGTVNIEKGVAPAMWTSDVDLTPVPQNVNNSSPAQEQAKDEPEEAAQTEEPATQQEAPAVQATPQDQEVKASKPEAPKAPVQEQPKEAPKAENNSEG